MVDKIWIERTRHQRKVFALQNPDYGLGEHGVFIYNNHIIEQTYASKIIKEMVHVFHGKDVRGSKRGCIPPMFDALQ